jgi:hypothetical protein
MITGPVSSKGRNSKMTGNTNNAALGSVSHRLKQSKTYLSHTDVLSGTDQKSSYSKQNSSYANNFSGNDKKQRIPIIEKDEESSSSSNSLSKKSEIKYISHSMVSGTNTDQMDYPPSTA